jgi:hypothetical protein
MYSRSRYTDEKLPDRELINFSIKYFVTGDYTRKSLLVYYGPLSKYV